VTVARVLDLVPPPPRTVRRRRGYNQIFLTYAMLVVALLFAQVFWMVTVGVVKLHFFGTVVPARVTKVWSEPRPRGPSHHVAVAYRYEDAEYTQKLTVGKAEAQALKVGDTLPVEVLAESPDRACLYYEHYPFWFVTILCCVFALGPTAAVGKCLWNLYVTPWKLRRLLRHGEATAGVVVDKQATRGRPPTYVLTYQFQPPARPWEGGDSASPPAVKASMKVYSDDFLGCQVGDPVLVVYDPARPRRSVIYRYADYEYIVG
jgi:hypothetical protein